MLAMADSNGQCSVFLLSHGNKRGIESVNSREKIPPGSGSPRRPTRSELLNFLTSAVGRLRNSPERTFQRLGTQTEARRKQPRNRDTEMSRGNASVISREKSSRGSDSPRRPTRSGLRNFIASDVGRLRNSPGRIFQRLGTQTDARRI